MQIPDQIATTPSQTVIISVLLGAYTATGSAAIGILLIAVTDSLRAYWINGLLICAALGLIVTSGFGIWNLLAPKHDLTPLDALPPEAAPARPLTARERIHAAAAEIMALHFVDGLLATRPECEESGVSQTDWNIVNRCLQETGIKTARAWQAGSLEEALTRWRAQVRIDDDLTIWTKPAVESRTWRKVN